MSRWETFTFRINQEEKENLKTLASHYHRTQSDTVRFLLSRAIDEIFSDSIGKRKAPKIISRIHSRDEIKKGKNEQ